MGKKKQEDISAFWKDPHVLYEEAVQSAGTDLDFVQRVWRKRRHRPLRLLREDFCGTAALACEWVKRNPENRAWGVDLDLETLNWGHRHHLSKLGRTAERVILINDDVMTASTPPVDAAVAFNFSYSIFKEREVLRRYFFHVFSELAEDGIFVMDVFGGTLATQTNKEKRKVKASKGPDGKKVPAFRYYWEHEHFNVVNHDIMCHIHFKLHDGTMIKKAFTYDWRLWSLQEMKEILLEVGFSQADVYIHGWDEDGESDDIFRLRKRYENVEGWVAYMVALK
ncbi:MAG: class I SAM-dependent methyltransferase [Verrucomicrobia bacterium]|nr:class I SAM-dependent methyltransferase [Verrucomicrobiota bacterium]